MLRGPCQVVLRAPRGEGEREALHLEEGWRHLCEGVRRVAVTGGGKEETHVKLGLRLKEFREFNYLWREEEACKEII